MRRAEQRPAQPVASTQSRPAWTRSPPWMQSRPTLARPVPSRRALAMTQPAVMRRTGMMQPAVTRPAVVEGRTWSSTSTRRGLRAAPLRLPGPGMAGTAPPVQTRRAQLPAGRREAAAREAPVRAPATEPVAAIPPSWGRAACSRRCGAALRTADCVARSATLLRAACASRRVDRRRVLRPALRRSCPARLRDAVLDPATPTSIAPARSAAAEWRYPASQRPASARAAVAAAARTKAPVVTRWPA
jgi:hypothetical protein